MEIKDYLRVIGRRAWILVLAPLVAGLVAFGAAERQPKQYRAVATVVVPETPGAGSPTAVFQFVSNYDSALRSPAVVQRVADATKVDKDRLTDGLRSGQLGKSTIIQTTYTDTSGAQVTKVLPVAIRETLNLLAEPKVGAAREKVTSAEKQSEEAQKGMDAFRSTTGLVLPNEEYRVAAGELSQLKVLLQQAMVAEEPSATKIAGLEAAIAERATRVGEIGAQVAVFNQLQERQQQATVNLTRAREELQAAEAQVAANNKGSFVTLAGTSAVPERPYVISRVRAAVASAVALSIGLVILLELLGSSRARREEPAFGADLVPPPRAAMSSAEPEPQPVRSS